jgi:hypothetical protein
MESRGEIGLQYRCFAGKSSGAFSCRQQSGVIEVPESATDKWMDGNVSFLMSIDSSNARKDHKKEMHDNGAM